MVRKKQDFSSSKSNEADEQKQSSSQQSFDDNSDSLFLLGNHSKIPINLVQQEGTSNDLSMLPMKIDENKITKKRRNEFDENESKRKIRLVTPIQNSHENLIIRDNETECNFDEESEFFEFETIETDAESVMSFSTLNEFSRKRKFHRQKNEHEKKYPFLMQAAEIGHEFYSLSEMDKNCCYCKAVFFAEEQNRREQLRAKKGQQSFYACCSHGQLNAVMATRIGNYPDAWKHFFSNPKFMEQIIYINGSFALASLQCKKIKFNTPGPYCFKVQGNVYHLINTIATPEEDEDPSYGQLYFLDTKEAQDIRKSQHQFHPSINPILEEIEIFLHNSNQFAQSYKMMKEVYSEMELKCKELNEPMPEIKMLFKIPEGLDKRRFNLPQSNEISAIVVTKPNGEIPPARVVVHEKGKKMLKNLWPLDSMVEPMMYPLLYPYGQLGWDCKLEDSTGKKITLCDYVKYILYYRPDIFSPHHNGKKLMQQWVVDMYARIEWARAQYIINNQKEIAKTTHKDIQDYLLEKAAQKNAKIVHKTILPSSFIGSPRSQHQHYLDALCVFNNTGKPDYFLTFTINPKDPDILKSIPKGDKAEDHPAIVSRVFNLKKKKLIELIKGGLFGKFVAFVWVIEYQKRGLPHVHMLFTVEKEYKNFNPDQIDSVIQAQIPDEALNPNLYNLVTKHMIHGPCQKGSPCWNPKKGKDGGCDKGFPKKFREKTEFNENGVPFYARPDNGRHVYRKNQRLTNEYVVPYNPALLEIFNSHINIEKVSNIKAIKYLFKYIFKGYDKAAIEFWMTDANGKQLLLKYDEVVAYMEARFISPIEACTRIFKFPLQDKSHYVEALDIHLEGKQSAYFPINATDEAIEQVLHKESKLTAYFKFLQTNPTITCLYAEMPKKCIWDKKNRCWKLRQRCDNVFGRIHYIDPKQSEEFHLRLMLLRICERSFQDYYCYNGIQYKTYAQSALARGFCKDDKEYIKCMEEASAFKMPKGLRVLFCNILVHCSPKNPEKLWTLFKDELSEDIVRNHKNLSAERVYAMTLFLLNEQLEEMGKPLSSFKTLPQQIEFIADDDSEETFDPILEKQRAKELMDEMNEGQTKIMETLNEAIVGSKQILAFIDGPGGTGKSYTLDALYHLGRANEKHICNMAFSGIAATILKFGQTVHKRFKFPLDMNEDSTSQITNQGKEFEEIRNTNVFIWDEAPMASKYVLDAVDRKLREIMQINEPFGGKSMILAGDFRQILNILEHATRTEIIDLLIKKSKLWKNFIHLELTENMRALKTERDFAKTLLNIGNGTNGYEESIELKDECVLYGNASLVDEIYGEIFQKENFDQLKDRAILAPYNSVVDNYNTQVIEKFPGEMIELFSIDNASPCSDMQIPIEMLNNTNIAGMPLHKLCLKKGCTLMLLRNLNVRQGLCNGTRLKLLEAGKFVLQCKIINGDRSGEDVFIPRITLSEQKKLPFILERHQFPVRLAFSFTINKSQSQTFTKIGIDYRNPPFAHGHSYVALSRVRSWNGIKVLLPEEDGNKMKNIVWKEALN